MELVPITEDDKPVWKCKEPFDECLEVFQKAPIFNGKTFWKAEKILSERMNEGEISERKHHSRVYTVYRKIAQLQKLSLLVQW